MPDIGSIVTAAGVVADVLDLVNGNGNGNNGNDNNKTPTPSGGKRGLLRGARLEYNVPEFNGRVLIKEPIGYWFELTPIYPEYGVFKASGKQGQQKPNNTGKTYTKRAGYRFATYTILLKPGTSIKVPVYTASQQRTGFKGADKTETRNIGNISIGVSSNVSVNEFIEFLKKSKKASQIIGCISPKQRKYQWAGVLHGAKGGGGSNDIDLNIGGVQLDIPGI